MKTKANHDLVSLVNSVGYFLYRIQRKRYEKSLPNITTRQWDTGNGGVSIRLETSFGWLRSHYDSRTRRYEIVDYYVWRPHRGKGHGKTLLKLARKQAKELGAKTVFGDPIISRESLDAVSSVFGRKSVAIQNLGDYTPEGRDDNKENRTRASFTLAL